MSTATRTRKPSRSSSPRRAGRVGAALALASVGLLGAGQAAAAPAALEAEIGCSAPNGGISVDGQPPVVLESGESVIVEVTATGSDVALWSCGWGDPDCGWLHYTVSAGERWVIAAVDPAPRIVMAQLVGEVPQFELSWGHGGTAEGEFSLAWGLAVDASDRIFVVEAAGDRVQRFDAQGGFQLLWGWGVATGAETLEVCDQSCSGAIRGSGTGQLDGPRGAAVAADGRVYVADEQNSRIQVYDSDGAFVESWGWGVATGAPQFERCTQGCREGIRGGGEGQFSFPHSVEVDAATGEVYVVDAVNNRIQKLDSGGGFLTMYGWGLGGVWLSNPSDAALDAEGNLYVVDIGNSRIVKIAPSGELLTAWGEPGSGPGQFNQPHAVTVDLAGHVLVAERENHRVQIFGADGGYLNMWGSEGVADGQFVVCTEVVTDSLGDVYVLDHTERIQKFTVSSGSLTSGLIDAVAELDVEAGIETSLVSSLASALGILEDGNEANDAAAIGQLTAFVHKVEAQAGKALSASEAQRLIGWAEAVIAKESAG